MSFSLGLLHLINFLNKYSMPGEPPKNLLTLNCSSIHPANLIRLSYSRNKPQLPQYHKVHICLEYQCLCLSFRPNWNPHALSKGNQRWEVHTRLRVRGWGVESPNSNDWRESLVLCLLCGQYHCLCQCSHLE